MIQNYYKIINQINLIALVGLTCIVLLAVDLADVALIFLFDKLS
jgi:hypothetical protein